MEFQCSDSQLTECHIHKVLETDLHWALSPLGQAEHC